MTFDVMLVVLKRFNRWLLSEQRKVILFLDNATCHPESMVDSFSQIKIIFLHLRAQLRDSSHLMLVLFKTSRSSIGKSWLSMCSQESMKTLLQRKSLKVVSATFLRVCYLNLNDSTCQIRKNIFLFHSKSSFCSQENQILELYIFKFHDVIKCLSVKQEIHFIE